MPSPDAFAHEACDHRASGLPGLALLPTTTHICGVFSAWREPSHSEQSAGRQVSTRRPLHAAFSGTGLLVGGHILPLVSHCEAPHVVDAGSGDLNGSNVFPHSSGGRRSKVEEPAELVPSEASLLACRLAASSRGLPSAPVCFLIPVSYEDTGPTG